MFEEKAACSKLSQHLADLGEGLDEYLNFEHKDAMNNADDWKRALSSDLPEEGIGIENVIQEIKQYLLPNASTIPKPGFSSFITTGASSSAILAGLSSAVASPQRFNLTSYNFLEELSLNWMRDLFSLPEEMKGVYSSGGSIANIVALGAARQKAFEAIGINPAQDGIQLPCRIYASEACHRTVHRAAAVLGMGSDSVMALPTDSSGRLSITALEECLKNDALEKKQGNKFVQVAIVTNAGTTDTGAIDPLKEAAELARHYGLWLHIDGAYGLPGILDPEVEHLFDGLEFADSVSVDPHKWLGAPVGIGATFVTDRALLFRAFTQGTAPYLEGAFSDDEAQNSMDSLGIPYGDFGLELSAPSRGAVVWAIIREIGKAGLRDRVCRHNAMAQYIAKRVKEHPDLELALEPTLSICCFRYARKGAGNLDTLNRRIHRQLVHNGNNIPSTTVIDGNLVIRPCFIGARANPECAESLIDEFLEITENILGNDPFSSS